MRDDIKMDHTEIDESTMKCIKQALHLCVTSVFHEGKLGSEAEKILLLNIQELLNE
jgi:hypothetical protein